MSGNFYDLLASRFPDDRTRPCFLLETGEISYGALETGAGRLAKLLHQRGVLPGDRIAVQAPKAPETVMLYLATLMVGAVYLPLNTGYTEHEIRYFLDDAEPVLMVLDAVAFAREADHLAPLEHSTPRRPDDLAAIVYTSGTTGRSKGAMINHANLAANAMALHAAWGFRPGDVLLHALPIFHIHGLFIALHTALLNGSPMAWLSKFDLEPVLKALRVSTMMMGVPTFYVRLLEHPEFGQASCGGVRLFICGSAPLLESTFEAFEQRTGHRILERYGMSEAGIITTNPLVGERVAGSVGYPLPDVALRVNERTEEIEIRGPSVFTGYWRMPEKTQEEFTADGYFKTGDIARQDPDGRVWISGRAKDLIITGGFNVYPREVELVIDALPGVVESAVIAVPHKDFGEAVVAVVVSSGSEEILIAAIRTRLASFKAPKRLFLVEELPRNAMGKVQKAVLRETYAKTFNSSDY